MKEGKIIKGVSEFYYVKTASNLYTCKGRGVFRKREVTPFVGDRVKFEVTDELEGYIKEILPRENQLSRPPIANIDQAVIVSSARKPHFNPLLLDRFLVMIEARRIEPKIFITKMDLVSNEEKEEIKGYKEYYEKIGYHVELLVSNENSDLSFLKVLFQDKTSVFAGQSGVGKSSILNRLNPELLVKTDEISERLGRGKHTTRYVELLEVGQGLVADTPGFSTVDFHNIEIEDVSNYFLDMREVADQCRFRGCLHLKEPNCAVKQAVDQGDIAKFRYKSYTKFCEEIQQRKPRY